ncbi:MAG: D-alanine-D-alanine ligase [Rhodothermales bacterium]|jgi:D-alanine-D-alanine ligase
MTIGLIYDLHQSYPWRPGDPPDADAEYEPIETVEALEQAIGALGHDTLRIGTPRDLLLRGPRGIDAAVNIAEGAWTRNREGWAPTLLEMWGIPYLGSDALALSLSLDKVYTKELAAAAGLHTPAFASFEAGQEVVAPAGYPLFVKPRLEGTAKGIRPSSVVHNLAELEAEVAFVTREYGQAALVEAFIVGGGEYTVAVVGNPPRALPMLQRAVDQGTRIGSHALERFGDRAWALEGTMDPGLESLMQRQSLAVFEKLGCRDFARIDFRVDADGIAWFLEINPLPTFAPDGTFAVMAELMGQSYPEFLSDLLREALERALSERQPSYTDHA